MSSTTVNGGGSSRSSAGFTARLAHDIRGHASVILAYTDLLRGQATSADRDQEREEFLDTIERQCRELMALSGNLRLCRQIETDELPMEFRPLDMTAIVTGSLARWRARAAEREVELDWSGPPQIGVRGDAEHLERLIEELVHNAVVYTPCGQRATVSLLADDAALSIDLLSGGARLDPDELERIFQPFYRGTSATTASVAGHGLGLWISRAIVAAHGGALRAEILPGTGVRVRLSLPRHGGVLTACEPPPTATTSL